MLAVAHLDDTAVHSLKTPSAHKEAKFTGDLTTPVCKLEQKSVYFQETSIL